VEKLGRIACLRTMMAQYFHSHLVSKQSASSANKSSSTPQPPSAATEQPNPASTTSCGIHPIRSRFRVSPNALYLSVYFKAYSRVQNYLSHYRPASNQHPALQRCAPASGTTGPRAPTESSRAGTFASAPSTALIAGLSSRRTAISRVDA